eukprot:TRINITY_DN13139_c0_g1_i2.p1 TRINITY_DN13139_c0_g1~~TRINITY_DN13139_c0_g1_i2.p1  ORF type:complete len:439 (-),score=52.46 TRINITY_DN13139_c0_g1_i2:490-1806(-)
MSAQKYFDVLIVGGGMVGATMAAALSCSAITQKLKIGLIDSASRPAQQQSTKDDSLGLGPVPGSRVSTITPRTQALFQKIGMWTSLEPPASQAFGSMQVWDSVGEGYIHWEAEDLQQTVMAHVVENQLIQQAAIQKFQDNVQSYWGSKVSNIVFPKDEGLCQVHVEGSEPLETRLVIGADGGGSRVRQFASLRSFGFKYNQRGVVATVETTLPERIVAWQKFLPMGPLALLPVRDGYFNIVWSTSPSQAEHLESLSEIQFADEVNAALQPTSGSESINQRSILSKLFGGKQQAHPFINPPKILRSVGDPVKSFPLQLLHSGRYARKRLALIGDAGHVVHPLAGQGVNLGFGDVEELLQTIQQAIQTGQEIGSLEVLRNNYESKRQQENLIMMWTLDGLRRTFAANPPGFGLLRNMGMEFINNMPLIRNQVMKYAMGQQ